MKAKVEETQVEPVTQIEHGTLVVSMLLTHQQITEFYLNGSMSCGTIQRLTKNLIDKNIEITPIMQNALLKYVKDTLKRDKGSNI